MCFCIVAVTVYLKSCIFLTALGHGSLCHKWLAVVFRIVKSLVSVFVEML